MLIALKQWYNINHMALNTDKCFFRNPFYRFNTINYIYYLDVPPPAVQIKDLGMDNDVYYFSLESQKNSLPTHLEHCLFITLVRPISLYGAPVGLLYYNNHCLNIGKIQNKFLITK